MERIVSPHPCGSPSQHGDRVRPCRVWRWVPRTSQTEVSGNRPESSAVTGPQTHIPALLASCSRTAQGRGAGKGWLLVLGGAEHQQQPPGVPTGLEPGTRSPTKPRARIRRGLCLGDPAGLERGRGRDSGHWEGACTWALMPATLRPSVPDGAREAAAATAQPRPPAHTPPGALLMAKSPGKGSRHSLPSLEARVGVAETTGELNRRSPGSRCAGLGPAPHAPCAPAPLRQLLAPSVCLRWGAQDGGVIHSVAPAPQPRGWRAENQRPSCPWTPACAPFGSPKCVCVGGKAEEGSAEVPGSPPVVPLKALAQWQELELSCVTLCDAV